MTTPKRGIMTKPFAPPPPSSELEPRGQMLHRMRKIATQEDRDEALDRALRTMPWASRIAKMKAYCSSGIWCFVCWKEAA